MSALNPYHLTLDEPDLLVVCDGISQDYYSTYSIESKNGEAKDIARGISKEERKQIDSEAAFSCWQRKQRCAEEAAKRLKYEQTDEFKEKEKVRIALLEQGHRISMLENQAREEAERREVEREIANRSGLWSRDRDYNDYWHKKPFEKEQEALGRLDPTRWKRKPSSEKGEW